MAGIQGGVMNFQQNMNEAIIPDCNFIWREVFRSKKAEQRRIDNTTSDPAILNNVIYLVENNLQPARDWAQEPLIVNSWYRSKELNKAVGGSPTSFHSYGAAADIRFANYDRSLMELFAFFYTQTQFTELIAEEITPTGGCIHIAHMKGRGIEKQVKYKLYGGPVINAKYNDIRKIFNA